MESCIEGIQEKVYPVLERVSGEDQDIVVTHIKNLMLPEEVDYILDNSGTFEDTQIKGRTSTSSFLKKYKDDVFDCLGKRISTIAGEEFKRSEPFQIVNYNHEQEYKPHVDSQQNSKVCDESMNHNYHNMCNMDGKYTKRNKTVFAYLKADGLEGKTCGGSTSFPLVKNKDGGELHVYPVVGDAVMWNNTKPNGDVNVLSLHAGNPILCNEANKVGLNVWFTSEETISNYHNRNGFNVPKYYGE
jgi:hypothetical protein